MYGGYIDYASENMKQWRVYFLHTYLLDDNLRKQIPRKYLFIFKWNKYAI